MDNLHNRLKVELGRKNKTFTTVRKSILKLVGLQSFQWRNVVKYGKYSPAKFANFVYICITRRKSS